MMKVNRPKYSGNNFDNSSSLKNLKRSLYPYQALHRPLALFLIMLLFICPMQLYGSGDSLMQVISDRFTRLKESYPQEKLYIHTDKSHYLPGETVWFSLYLADASSHEASQHSRMVYVELTDTSGTVAKKRYIRVSGGRGSGDFLLDIDFEPGSWILRGYTNYMFNYSNTPLFSMELKVLDPYARVLSRYQSSSAGRSTQEFYTPPGSRRGRDQGNGPISEGTHINGAHGPSGEFHHAVDLSVRFFPEGGDLVGELMASVAVQSTDPDGRGVEVNGQVYDNLGNPSGSFVTGRFGLGRFMLNPDSGRQYYAVVEVDGERMRFELPEVKSRGYTLQVNNNMPDILLVNVSTNMDGGLDGALLAGHIRGQLFYLAELTGGDKALLYIDKLILPPGIAHFSIISADGLPVAERLVYTGSEEAMAQLVVSAGKEIYGNRERVELELELTDDFGYPLAGNFSLSVTDSYAVPSRHDRHNIMSYFLLSSDLPGLIEDPGYFLDTSNADRELLLDLLMMTHGWRRFRWEDLLSDNFPEIVYAPGKAHVIRGRVTSREKHDVPLRSNVILMAVGKEFSAASQVTCENGIFLFDEIEFHDTTYLVLQGNIYDERREQSRVRRGQVENFRAGRNNSIHFHINEPEFVPGRVDIPAASIADEAMEAYFEDSRKDHMLSHHEEIWNLEIEEVEIRRRKLARENL
jgi:hypothetical protein